MTLFELMCGLAVVLVGSLVLWVLFMWALAVVLVGSIGAGSGD